MSEASLDHPTDDRLAAHALGLLDEEQAAEVSAHLERCAACRSFVETAPPGDLIALSSTMTGLPPRPKAGPDATAPPAPPARQPSTLDAAQARPSQAADASFTLSPGPDVPAGL